MKQLFEDMKLEDFDTMPELINLSFKLNRYPLIQDISDMGKIGREYLFSVSGCVLAHDENDPKYAQLGRGLVQSGNGIFTEYGLLFVDENTPFNEVYDGQVFSAYILAECALHCGSRIQRQNQISVSALRRSSHR